MVEHMLSVLGTLALVPKNQNNFGPKRKNSPNATQRESDRSTGKQKKSRKGETVK